MRPRAARINLMGSVLDHSDLERICEKEVNSVKDHTSCKDHRGQAKGLRCLESSVSSRDLQAALHPNSNILYMVQLQYQNNPSLIMMSKLFE